MTESAADVRRLRKLASEHAALAGAAGDPAEKNRLLLMAAEYLHRAQKLEEWMAQARGGRGKRS